MLRGAIDHLLFHQKHESLEPQADLAIRYCHKVLLMIRNPNGGEEEGEHGNARSRTHTANVRRA